VYPLSPGPLRARSGRVDASSAPQGTQLNDRWHVAEGRLVAEDRRCLGFSTLRWNATGHAQDRPEVGRGRWVPDSSDAVLASV